MNGLKEAPKPGKDYTPKYNTALVREKISRQNNFPQAGNTYRNFEDWERNDLINNLVSTFAPTQQHILDNKITLFTQCDADYGKRIADGLMQFKAMKNSDNSNGTSHNDEAVQQAMEESIEAKAY